MERLTEAVGGVALGAGADLVGFAPISRFDNAPPRLHPRTIFPSVRTVVAIAVRQPRGALKAVEEGTYRQAYDRGPGVISGTYQALREGGLK